MCPSRSRPFIRGIVSICIVGCVVWSGCDAVQPPTENVTYRIDSTAAAISEPTVAGFAGGPPRPVAALVGPTGVKTEFVEDDVVIRPTSEDDLNAFLQRYGGTVVHDGTLPIDPDIPHRDLGPTGYYLIHIDPATSSLDDFGTNMEKAGVEGEIVFSSEKAARLVSLLARETGLRAQADALLHETFDYNEHPIGPTDFLVANNWPWMGKYDPVKIRVAQAWDYLSYHKTPPTPPAGG